MSQAPGRPRVIYIMGSGRSGTTLLGSILGEYTGAFGAGEISYIWERGILQPRGCGCGREPLECPVWGRVIERLAEGQDPRLLAEAQLERRHWIRLRHTGALLRMGRISPSSSIAERLPRSHAARVAYGRALMRLYGLLVEVTGRGTIIDTSKHPADAALLGQLDGIESTFVHVVRDARGVTHSWRRKKEGIARRKTILAALDWVVTNRAADAVRARHPRASMMLRYEDLMLAPVEHATRIARLAGLPPEPTPFADATTVRLGTNHTVSGNPDRFTSGLTAIQMDDRWHRAMPASLRSLVTGLTAIDLRRYGYALRG